jgi:hypothetical protein
MNYLEIYINSLPLEIPMNFGINKPVILNAIDIEPRLTRKGDPHSKNFFMEFLKLDEEGKPYQREEFSFFKLRADKLEFLSDNFFDQFNKMYNLAQIYMPADELNKALQTTMEEIYKNNTTHNDLIDHLDYLVGTESKTIKKKKLTSAELLEEVEDLNENLNLFWYKILSKHIGENSKKLQLLTVVDKKGYKNLVDEVKFVSSLEDNLVIDIKYIKRKEASEKPIKADDIATDTASEEVDALASLAVDEDYDIEDDNIVLD